jgi:hypothetical protein
MTIAPARAGTGRAAASRRVIVGALSLTAALVLCAVAVATADTPTRSVVWGSMALGSYAVGLLFLSATDPSRLGLARWKLGPWILLWYGVSYGLASATWAAPQTSTAAQIEISSVLRALWLVAVGMTAWAMGYAAGPGHPLRRLARRRINALNNRLNDTVRSRSAPWVLYAVGAAARLANAISSGRFGYVGDAASAVSSATGYGQILSDLSLFAPLAVAAAALQVYRERLPGARITLAVLFLAELAFGAAGGGKESFVIAVLAVAIPMSTVRHRLSKVVVAGSILIFLVIVIPFNQAYRAAARGTTTTLSAAQAVDQAPAILRQTLTGHSLVTILPNSMIYLLQRITEIDSPAIILQRTPAQIPYSSPAQLVEAPAADIVPRVIWPGKPILAIGYQFNQQYYGLPSTIYSSSAVTPIGDLYRHGGWIPVIAGMFMLGCGVRLLDDVLDVRANPHAIFLVLLFFPSLVQGEEDLVTLLAGIPATVLVWLSATIFTFRRRERMAGRVP